MSASTDPSTADVFVEHISADTSTTDEPPTKRIRLSSPLNFLPKGRAETEHLQKELKAGITAFVSPNTCGFSGVLKQRYTDFLVNEILPNGEVLRLDSMKLRSDAAVEGESHQTHGKNEATENVEREGDSGQATDGVVNEAVKQEGREHAQQDAEMGENIVADVWFSQYARRNVDTDSGQHISSGDREALISIFGMETTNAITKLYSSVLRNPHRKSREFKPVVSTPIADKEVRTTAHQSIRRIFSSRLNTVTNDENSIRITAASPQGKNQIWSRSAGTGREYGKLGWKELGGEYLHFTLYKENKDTMEVMYYLASQLKQHVKNFQFAGTKDRRGVTVQRVSVFRIHAERMAGLNKTLKNAVVGGFKYEPNGLSLGDLRGNEFVITLRDCRFPDSEGLDIEARTQYARHVVTEAMKNLQEKGFINYFGLQRFGSFATSTDEIGKKLLQGDFEAAIALILSRSETTLSTAQGKINDTTISSDDRNRALALDRWHTTGNTNMALEIMPRKFSAEISIIRHLGMVKSGKKVRGNDWQGAIMSVQRNLRLMYVHAYQSLVWNTVAGRRWELFGDKVTEGDLVIVDEDKDADGAEEFDELGEVIVRPKGEDRATTEGDYTRARPLSKEEAESGRWTIFDIVLPLPGWDVVYPLNKVGEFYKEFMGSEKGGGLDPNDMRRKQKDFSLSGGYRKILARPEPGLTWEVRTYFGVNEQLVSTDLERLLEEERKDKVEDESDVKKEIMDGDAKLAVILRMHLGASQYATMALRELMKAGGVKSYQADFGTGR